MREVDIMSTFEHRNILTLKGVVLRDAGNSPWMVFEYMPYGDLAEVLRSNSRQLHSPNPGLEPLTKVIIRKYLTSVYFFNLLFSFLLRQSTFLFIRILYIGYPFK